MRAMNAARMVSSVSVLFLDDRGPLRERSHVVQFLSSARIGPLSAVRQPRHGRLQAVLTGYLHPERGRLVLLDGASYRTQHVDLDVDGPESSLSELAPRAARCWSLPAGAA